MSDSVAFFFVSPPIEQPKYENAWHSPSKLCLSFRAFSSFVCGKTVPYTEKVSDWGASMLILEWLSLLTVTSYDSLSLLQSAQGKGFDTLKDVFAQLTIHNKNSHLEYLLEILILHFCSFIKSFRANGVCQEKQNTWCHYLEKTVITTGVKQPSNPPFFSWL